MSTGKVHSENTSGFKSREQIEFGDLFRELGWKPVDVARALHVSRSAITMILQGIRNPRSATLEGIRVLVETQRKAKERGEKIETKFGEGERLTDQLDYLREHSPARYEAAKITVDALHKQAAEESGEPEVILYEKGGKPKPANSKLVSEAAAASKAALERMGKGASYGKESPRSRGAGARRLRKDQQSRSSSEVAKAPPPDPEGKDQK